MTWIKALIAAVTEAVRGWVSFHRTRADELQRDLDECVEQNRRHVKAQAELERDRDRWKEKARASMSLDDRADALAGVRNDAPAASAPGVPPRKRTP